MKSDVECLPALNGTFLEGYDGRRAKRTGVVERYRRKQLKAHHRKGLILQAASPPEPEGSRFELILDESNLLPFDFLRTGDQLGRAVVKIQRSDGASGTGFLVAPDVLLTNHHVLPDFVTAAGATATANFETNPPSDPAGRTEIVPLQPGRLFVTNDELDFTFCGVEGLDFLGVIPLNRNSLNVMTSEYVNIIQHPRGRPKEVALQDNQVVKVDNVVVQYSCDTEPGSSGSPVFNNQWQLVALHHASVVADGRHGRRSPGSPANARFLNEGIRLSAIALWLETAEANTPQGREQVARLRSIFEGLDPQIGFFGALGRHGSGRNAAEVVVASYRGGGETLDVAYWDLSGLPGPVRDHLDNLGWAIADMNMDLWCLSGIEPEDARRLSEHLDSHFRLDYRLLSEIDGPDSSQVVLVRQSRSLSVEPVRGNPIQERREPGHLLIRSSPRQGEEVSIRLLPRVGTQGALAREQMETLARLEPICDTVLIGNETASLSPDDLQALRDAGLEPHTADAGRAGAVTILSCPTSRVARIFVSANLTPGHSSELTPTHDRELPSSAKALAGPDPIALRLTFGDASQRAQGAVYAPYPIASIPCRSQVVETTSPAVSAVVQRDADPRLPIDPSLEQTLRKLLTPIIAQIVAEVRQKPPDGDGS